MSGNFGGRPVGRCGLCGGVVSMPRIWHGVQRPPKACESCGAEADEAAMLPTLPMRKTRSSDFCSPMEYPNSLGRYSPPPFSNTKWLSCRE